VISGLKGNVGVLNPSHGAAVFRTEKAWPFLFLCPHEIGTQSPYAEVPYGRWTGWRFGRERKNLVGLAYKHFDRAVDLR
jgi:uncharacterized membrane protein YjdF